MRTWLLFLCARVTMTGARKLPSPTSGPTLKKVAEFDLPGPPGKRFDYLTIDADDHYLISAHLAAGQTYVIDLGTNKVVATIGDTPGAEGVEYVPDLHKFYTSNAYDNTIGVVDLKQMKVVKKLKTEAKPDGSTYAAPFHKLYVSDERGKAEAIVDVTKDEIITVPVIVRDDKTHSRGYSDKQFWSIHIHGSNEPDPKHDGAYDAFVKMYRDNSDIKSAYDICLPNHSRPN